LTLKYQDILEAKELLNLSGRVSMKEIKSNYRRLINEWHPDKCREDHERCNDMTRKIVAAYGVIINYCNNYKYSFETEEIRTYLSAEEWWFERFGSDPLWGKY
jgi:DnaJ-class molecular chaperone